MADLQSNNKDSKPVSIHIMGNEYHVASPADEVEKLEEAARALDKRMKEIKEAGPVLGLEKVAVMAALNLSYELMHGESTSAEETSAINQRIDSLTQKVEQALASTAQTELL